MEAVQDYKLARKIKDDKFDVDKLHLYNLLLQIGPRDLHVAVTDRETSKCLLLEEFRLKAVKDYQGLIEVLARIFDEHHLLMAGFWQSVRVAIKNRKFTLVSAPLFVEDNLYDYLSLNCAVNKASDSLHYYRHTQTEGVNIFSANKTLIDWLKQVYPNIEIQVIHQGSALIEGILTNDGHSQDKGMFLHIDRAIVHVVVSQDRKLKYYNQFTVKSPDDAIKYILLVFKALGLDQKLTKVMVWGTIAPDSSFYQLLAENIQKVSLGNKPSYLKFNYAFDEIQDHQYFDLYSMNLCE